MKKEMSLILFVSELMLCFSLIYNAFVVPGVPSKTQEPKHPKPEYIDPYPHKIWCFASAALFDGALAYGILNNKGE